jgi:hypothetical protein
MGDEERFLDDVRRIDTSDYPPIDSRPDHRPQPGPVANEQLIRGILIPGPRTSDEVIGI